jgi:acetyl-CoA carboxylase biotin carboxylase subunit
VFKRLLIANRGEIAVRVIRTCREMGIESVALFSDADANALHIVLANYAERLAGTSPADTYLHIEKVIAACRKWNVDAVHPGYGFLSENHLFAQACADNGIVFIGPSPQAILDLGNKVKAKDLARAAGTPTVPGTEGAVSGIDEARAFCEQAGYPVMLKAAAGGGGRGMRVVRQAADLEKLLISCQNEARGAFGSDEVFIEKYVEQPKHIEFQVLADQHGNVIHLGERDCSVQRRHQKLIEEAPSPALDHELRERMGATAVALAKAANYVNAGTVEFLLDSNREFYFMEMNTRLQVEHPVTELVYGVDLVRWQIKIAAGEPLTIQQEQVRPRGWSFEARINAEDPLRGFVPALGRLNRYIPPAGHGVRMDSCAYEGYTIPSQYDSMVAKLIVTATSRDAAIGKMLRALDEFIITGVKTTIPFHRFVFSHPVFRSGSFDTGFVESYFSDDQVRELMHSRVSLEEDQNIAVAAGLQYYLERTALISSNARDDDKAGQRWSVVNRLASTSFIPG